MSESFISINIASLRLLFKPFKGQFRRSKMVMSSSDFNIPNVEFIVETRVLKSHPYH